MTKDGLTVKQRKCKHDYVLIYGFGGLDDYYSCTKCHAVKKA